MDGVDISAEAFHARLTDDADELPTTSQPAPADFLATFARAAEEGEEVLGVILGSGLSGTYASAEAAAGRFGDAPVHLVDSRGASLLQGLLVLKAAEMVELGAQPADVAAELRRLRDASGILFTVDRFDRLLASGRVGKGRAWLGSMLQVKPILELDRAGRVVPVAKAVGRERARHALLRALAERIPPDAERVRFGVAHVSAPDTVPVIGEELRRRYGPDVEVLSAPATPVIATHLGPGAWAVAYLVED